jgi:hypothetical protein
MKTQFKLKSLFLLAVTVCSTASASVVYDNTSNYLTNYFFSTPSTREFGDQINLASGFDRTVTQFQFEYFATNLVGLESLTFRIYSNANSNSAPIAPLFSIGPVAIQNGINTVTVDGLFLPVTDSITWTVQFNNVTGAGTAGLPLYGPATVGSSYDDFWQRNDTGTGWNAFRFPGGVPDGSFAARVTAVPEASTVVYTVLGALSLVGYQWNRRRLARS